MLLCFFIVLFLFLRSCVWMICNLLAYFIHLYIYLIPIWLYNSFMSISDVRFAWLCLAKFCSLTSSSYWSAISILPLIVLCMYVSDSSSDWLCLIHFRALTAIISVLSYMFDLSFDYICIVSVLVFIYMAPITYHDPNSSFDYICVCSHSSSFIYIYIYGSNSSYVCLTYLIQFNYFYI